ncbi:MAG TPA: serine hydrolase domain-containing protein [Streptosporangiaceae bacterium]|nr:serine hydrolase domain-containing protein [Streptosporangiaceae bacterium]
MRPGADQGPGEDDRSRAERCLEPLVSQRAVPSLTYAVVRDGDATLGGFGGAGPRTIFEIGSLTKVFTALLLADMAERGQVRLSDAAARYLPGGAGSVTLADLATLLRACLSASAGAASGGTPLDAALRVTMRPRSDIPSGQIGLAWHLTLRGDRELVWHNGMTGGYSAMIALDPVRGLGVAALANAAGIQPSPLDEAVFETLG